MTDLEMARMNEINLSEFVALPGLPGYLIREDGRVCSVRRGAPRLLTESRPSVYHDDLRTVKIGRKNLRVRDLTMAMFGKDIDFRQDRESEAHQAPNEDVGHAADEGDDRLHIKQLRHRAS